MRGDTLARFYRELGENLNGNRKGVPIRLASTKVTAKGYNVRNTALVDHGDVVLSRWDGRGHGGTYNCINQANGKGVPVFDAGTLKQIGIHHSRKQPSQDWQRLPDP